MSKNQFKAIDLVIFSILAVVFEFINYYASAKLGTYVLCFLSYTVILTLISVFRWGWIGVIPGLCGGFAACIASGNFTTQTLAIYIGGNLSLGLMYFFIKAVSHKAIKSNIALLLFYLLGGYLLVCLVRSLISMVFGYNFGSVFKDYFVTDSMSVLISFFILLIARKRDGMLTEMNGYLQETYEERTNPMKQLKVLHENPYYNPTAEVIDEEQFNDANIMEGGTLSQEDLDKLQKMYNEKERDNL